MNNPRSFVGRILQDRLTLIDMLGEGGMGVVYRAYDAETRQHVAVKLLSPEHAASPARRARFYREASASRRVQHANAVRFIGRGEDDGVCFLVMELLEGRPLAEILRTERRLDQGRSVRLMAQLCSALTVVHDRGLIHRDLKPENIMVSGVRGEGMSERVKLLDFGLAKPVADDDSLVMDLTESGALIGTPAYMAPEQCCGLPVDARTDLYACGVMLYEMVTGAPPFDALDPYELLRLHIGARVRPPSERAPGVCPALERVILQALSKEPTARHASAAALRRALLEVLDALAVIEDEDTAVMVHAAAPLQALPIAGAASPGFAR